MTRSIPLALLVALASAAALAADPAPPAPAPTSSAPATVSSAPLNVAKVVAYRQKTMKAASDHMAAASILAKGEVDRPQDMLVHADALHDLAGTVGALFPAGTGPKDTKTEAKTEIWSQADKFTEAAKAFEASTSALLDAAKKNDAAGFRDQLGKVGETCGNCHDTFKVDEG